MFSESELAVWIPTAGENKEVKEALELLRHAEHHHHRIVKVMNEGRDEPSVNKHSMDSYLDRLKQYLLEVAEEHRLRFFELWQAREDIRQKLAVQRALLEQSIQMNTSALKTIDDARAENWRNYRSGHSHDHYASMVSGNILYQAQLAGIVMILDLLPTLKIELELV